MFVLCEVQDDVRVAPQDLSLPTAQAVTAVLERSYIDRVVPNLGLVISLYDLLEVVGGVVVPNEGAPHFKVKFRLVIFRPFVGEVLVGKLAKVDR